MLVLILLLLVLLQGLVLLLRMVLVLLLGLELVVSTAHPRRLAGHAVPRTRTTQTKCVYHSMNLPLPWSLPWQLRTTVVIHRHGHHWDAEGTAWLWLGEQRGQAGAGAGADRGSWSPETSELRRHHWGHWHG